ncbi:MAG: addiction module protein [Alkalinema sp. RU_4_3]|nr:addiction module protein [Alkalinema sp. RU_4_3]
MDATLDNLMTTALTLTPDARIILAERLLKSLDTSEQAEIDNAWAELSDQHITEIETGQVTLISKDTILQQIRDRPKLSQPPAIPTPINTPSLPNRSHFCEGGLGERR